MAKGRIAAGKFIEHVCNEHVFANTDYFDVHYAIICCIHTVFIYTQPPNVESPQHEEWKIFYFVTRPITHEIMLKLINSFHIYFLKILMFIRDETKMLRIMIQCVIIVYCIGCCGNNSLHERTIL